MCIIFEELDGKVMLNPNSLHSRADLERTLRDYNLSIDGTFPTLRKRLSQHLMQLEARVTKMLGVGGRQVKWYIHRPRKSKLLPEIEAEERKPWDWKRLQLRSSARHLQCFRYTFHNGCCCREN